jgi:NAD(P)-dependent dehydrogenase (short-subunit alcohol dehydrogenase family)
MELSGRTVLITGAARGIGAQLARVVAARGARVSLVGLEPDRLAAVAAELGEGHAWFEADVCDQDALAAAVAGTVEALGGIDVVVANAGIANFGTVEKGDPDAWAKCVEVNVTGVFRTVHAALPHVIERKGYVLVVASLASFVAAPGLSAYSASKRGAEAFAESLRLEVGFRGVDVGSAHPSWIDTDLVRDAEHDLPSFKRMRSKLPWPANGTTSVEECAQALADGIEKRAVRICVPREVALVYYARQLVAGPLGRLGAKRDARKLLPEMEAEVAALGRPASERTTAINRL